MKPTLTHTDAEIGRRVKAARSKAGLHQHELATLVGVTRAAISRFERGTLRPSDVRLGKIAKATGVTFEHLAGPVEPDQGSGRGSEQAAGSAA